PTPPPHTQLYPLPLHDALPISTSVWVTQQARQITWTLPERSTPLRFLIRDRDGKFTRDFDTVFRSEGIEIIRTPVRAPKANAIADRKSTRLNSSHLGISYAVFC